MIYATSGRSLSLTLGCGRTRAPVPEKVGEIWAATCSNTMGRWRPWGTVPTGAGEGPCFGQRAGQWLGHGEKPYPPRTAGGVGWAAAGTQREVLREELDVEEVECCQR